MDKRRIEQIAAERILESGVRVTIPASLFLRLFGKKTVKLVIRQPFLGTLAYVSKLSLEAGFNFEEIDKGDLDAAHKLVSQHARTICRIIAVTVLGTRTRIRLFSGILSRWLLWKLKPRKLTEITMTIILLCGVQDFTSSIRLLRSLRITAPKNLSPSDQGSQENEEDSIAPGESSGV